MREIPEILAPVADREMLLAAIHNGAGAVYVGMPRFNARARTRDLTFEELREMREACDSYGVSLFVAFNVVIFEDEWPDVCDALEKLKVVAPHAVITQDIGLARLIHAAIPELPLHASTQMTTSSAEAIAFYEPIGFRRFNLSRETSLAEMRLIRAGTETELEVFVHGALCVAYSGQCLTSAAIGGRSANRGQCAQSCRLPYTMLVDGREVPVPDGNYLLSPQDLFALEDVPELLEIGIDSFKIEGRYKTPVYVATAVSAYASAAQEKSIADPEDLRLTFLRGNFSGWMKGVDHQRLVDPSVQSHSGIPLGTITGVNPYTSRISVRMHKIPENLPGPGDGIAIGSDTVQSNGSMLYSVSRHADVLTLGLANATDFTGIKIGMPVRWISRRETQQAARISYTDRGNFRKLPVRVRVSGGAGGPLLAEVWATSAGGREIHVQGRSDADLQPARKYGLSPETVVQEWTSAPYEVTSAEVDCEGALFIPAGALKELRQRSYQLLQDALRTPPYEGPPARTLLPELRITAGRIQDSLPILHVLLREPEQTEALLQLKDREGIGTILLDFERGRDIRAACEVLIAAGFPTGIATTRVYKAQEAQNNRLLAELRPEVVLLRNAGQWKFVQSLGSRIIADFSFNAVNSLSAAWLLNHGADRVTPGFDVNARQLGEVLRTAPQVAAATEIVVHHYMPEFHMEHCVFAAFLSTGSSWRDCGKPCEKHRVALRHPDGSEHALKADIECRNTLYAPQALTAARIVPDLIAAGVRHFRIEALFESPAELASKIESVRELLNGEDPDKVLRTLGGLEKVGVSESGWLRDRKKTTLVKSPG